MRRVMIVGGPGSGKSTLARWLGAQTGLPIQHMDQLHYLAGWVERVPRTKVAMIRAVEAQDSWIIEGGISTTYETRAARADVIIWLDLPVLLHIWRVLRRSWRYRGQSRPDLPEGCPEKFNVQTWTFLRWIWTYRQTQRAKILKVTAAPQIAMKVIHLKNRAAIARFQVEFAT